MNITIKRLTLKNFKGQKDLEINFNHITDIFGENAAGKTTVFDAFTWLFFDKDSSDRTSFELKPIGKDGKVSHKLDVEVAAILEVDGKKLEVRKVLHEKWVKKRGDVNLTFEGNENLYYWNDVPVRLKDYQAKIADLVNEHVFKLITNPLYFNSLKWQDRREVLLQIGGEIDNSDLVIGNPDFATIVKVLADMEFEEYKKMLAAKKKKIKDDLISIPTRIDEIHRNMPEAADFNAIRKSIAAKEKEIEGIESALLDASKLMQTAFDAKRKHQNDIHELKTKAANLKNDIRSRFVEEHNQRKSEISRIQSEIRAQESIISTATSQIANYSKNVSNCNAELETLRKEWVEENNKELKFDENEFVCPACHRDLDEANIHDQKEKLVNNFNTEKARRLAAIVEKSNSIKERLQTYAADIKKFEADKVSAENEIQSLKTMLAAKLEELEKWASDSEQAFNAQLDNNVEYVSILQKIFEMESRVDDDVKEEDNTELKEKKRVLRIEIDALKRQLNDEETIVKSKQRIKELEAQEADLAQQLADLEGREYLAAQFNRAKMDMLVEKINSRFKYVTFKMFNFTIDGGEIPTCETLVNGVPFADANNAAKINAGLDIINTLCEHYNVYAPIFIDNRESVSQLIDCDSQIVNLIVSPADKKLRVA